MWDKGIFAIKFSKQSKWEWVKVVLCVLRVNPAVSALSSPVHYWLRAGEGGKGRKSAA